MVGSHDPLAAVEDAINLGRFDAVIISTLPARMSRWLRLDLPHKVAALGLPVTHVAAEARKSSLWRRSASRARQPSSACWLLRQAGEGLPRASLWTSALDLDGLRACGGSVGMVHPRASAGRTSPDGARHSRTARRAEVETR